MLPPGAPTGKALSYINKHFFSDANGNRGGAPNVAVVLVDGWPTDKVEEASRLARESGINIFFVTIEGADDNEKQNLVETNFVDKVKYFHTGMSVLYRRHILKTHFSSACTRKVGFIECLPTHNVRKRGFKQANQIWLNLSLPKLENYLCKVLAYFCFRDASLKGQVLKQSVSDRG